MKLNVRQKRRLIASILIIIIIILIIWIVMTLIPHKNENVGDFIENVTKGYEEVIGYAPTFYVANISNGTRKIG